MQSWFCQPPKKSVRLRNHRSLPKEEAVLKLNLIKGSAIINLRPLKPLAAGMLFLLLVWQGVSYGQKSSEIQRKQTEIETLQTQLQALIEQERALGVPESFETLNGAIAARNEWLKLREKSPVFILAKLEKERPGAVELKSFESDETKGTIKMVAGDMDTASRYMNAVLGNTNVRVTMEERVKNGILAVCSWNE